MYVPGAFEQKDPAQWRQLIRDNPLATLVTLVDGELEANHIPLQHRENGSEFGVLVGHVARANSVWRGFSSGTPLLAVFSGGDAYISPSWYPSKQEHGKAVPTWNYLAAHVKGMVQIKTDPQWVLEMLNGLTEQHESQFEKPWAVADAPADYIEKLTQAIVGFEISITHVQSKWKLSQNHSEQNRQGVVAGLSSLGSEKSRKMAERVAASKLL
jgi:transcriptional regulator